MSPQDDNEFARLPKVKQEAVWRVVAAREQLGRIVGGNCRANMTIGEAEPMDGWLYFGLDELVFVSDVNVWGDTNDDRIIQAKFWKIGGGRELQNSLTRKRATVVFGNGSMIVGPKKEMKKLFMLASAVVG